MKKNQPIKCPTREEVSGAVEILGNQWLHVYQLLYFKKLTIPEGRPLTIKRVITSNSVTTQLKICHWKNEKLHFGCFGTEPDEEILDKAQMLVDGYGMELPFQLACCPYAKRISCVCHVAMTCKLHGETHIGTHD